MLQYLILVLTGVVGGFVAGFIGVGGGIIYIVVLPLIFQNYNVQDNQLAAVIVANSLFGIFLSSLVSVITHIRHRTFYIQETAIVSMPAVLVSALCLIFFVNTKNYSYAYFNAFIIILISTIIINYFFFQKAESKTDDLKNSNIKLGVSGALAGLVSALSGLGGSIVLIPLLRNLLKMEMLRVKSIALGMILMMTAVMTALNLSEDNIQNGFYGLINFKVVLPIALGVVFSSILGVKASHKVENKTIERTFIAFLLLVLMNKLYLIIV